MSIENHQQDIEAVKPQIVMMRASEAIMLKQESESPKVNARASDGMTIDEFIQWGCKCTG